MSIFTISLLLVLCSGIFGANSSKPPTAASWSAQPPATVPQHRPQPQPAVEPAAATPPTVSPVVPAPKPVQPSTEVALAEAPEPGEGVVGPSATEIIEGKVVGVTDGDTISVLDGKKTIKVRLEGIDAPESHQAYGTQWRKALFAKVYGKQVRVECTACGLLCIIAISRSTSGSF